MKEPVVKPRAPASRAMAAPMPRLPPVTRRTRSGEPWDIAGELTRSSPALLEGEVPRHHHHDLDRRAVQQRRLEPPLPHRVNSCLGEVGMDLAGGGSCPDDATVGADDGFDRDLALEPGL